MSKDAEQIGSYEARIHWGRLLDEVNDGTSYVISKHHQAIAAIVPIALWEQRGEGDDQELVALIEQLDRQQAATTASLTKALSKLASLKSSLSASYQQRHPAGPLDPKQEKDASASAKL